MRTVKPQPTLLTFKGSQLMQEKSSIQARDGYQTYCGLWVQVPQFLQSSSNQLFCELGTLHPGFTSIHAQDPVLEEKTKIIPGVPSTTWALPWSVTYWGWYFSISFSQCRWGDTPDSWTQWHGQTAGMGKSSLLCPSKNSNKEALASPVQWSVIYGVT